MANEQNRLTGLPALAYKGVEATSPIQLVYRKRDPLPNDKKNFLIGCLWVNRVTSAVWILVSLANNQATWIQFASTIGVPYEFQTQTGTSIPNGAGTLFLPNGNLIMTTNGGPNTVDISIVNGTNGQIPIGHGGVGSAWGDLTSIAGSVTITPGVGAVNLEVTVPSGITFATDAGNAVSAFDILEVYGDGIVTTHGFANDITLSLAAGPYHTTFHTDAGNAVEAGGQVNVLGGDAFIATAGAGNTVTINFNQPVGRIVNNCSFTAYADHVFNNAAGDANLRPIPANTLAFDTGGDYNPATYLFTAPRTGYYYLCGNILYSNVVVPPINVPFARIYLIINGQVIIPARAYKDFTPRAFMMHSDFGNCLSVNVFDFVNLNAGDTVSFQYIFWLDIAHPAAASANVYGAAAPNIYTWFGGYQVY